MRKRFARQKRRSLLREGAEILSEKWIKEPGWKRKDIGYSVNFVYEGRTYYCAGHDELSTYTVALDSSRLFGKLGEVLHV